MFGVLPVRVPVRGVRPEVEVTEIGLRTGGLLKFRHFHFGSDPSTSHSERAVQPPDEERLDDLS
jgi:hypothetical protein